MKHHAVGLRLSRRIHTILAGTGCALGAIAVAAAPANAFVSKPAPVPTGVHVDYKGYLIWDPSSMSAPQGYEVQRDAGTITPITATWGYWNDPNGQDGTAHTYRVAAVPAAGKSPAWSAPVTEPPLNLKVKNGQVCWDVVAGHTSVYDDSYLVYFNGNLAQIVTGASSGATCWLLPSNGLVPGAQYTVSVASSAQGSSVPESDQSPAQGFWYEPAPTGLTAMAVNTPAPGGIQLSWNPVPGATQYIVYSDGQPAIQVSTNSTIDFSAVPGSGHNYTVEAENNSQTGQNAQSSSVYGIRY